MTTIAFREEIDTSGAENAAGIAGLALRDGIINEEVNQELRSYQRRFEFFKEMTNDAAIATLLDCICLLYTSPSPRDRTRSRMPSSA